MDKKKRAVQSGALDAIFAKIIQGRGDSTVRCLQRAASLAAKPQSSV